MAHKVHIKNRRASYQYFLVEKMVAGIQLVGTEIKSIRQGKVSLADSYCQFVEGELYVKEMHIAEYNMGTHANHEAKRDRKLLLKKRELNKLEGKTKEKGFTIIPTLLFINEKGLAKLEIALARGKQFYDKRDTLKKKDLQREIDRGTRYQNL